MCHVNLSLYLFLVLWEISVTFTFTDPNAFQKLTQKYHKIRHFRHIFLQRNSVRTCVAKQYNYTKCPMKKCSKNIDCLEEYGDTKLCVCDPFLCGLVCLDFNDRCQIPKSPQNGKLKLKDLRVGDKVEYFCNEGYFMEGFNVRYCQANLKLSYQEPTCINSSTSNDTGCFILPNITNAKILTERKDGNFQFNELIQIICQKGFEDRNNPIINATCSLNKWQYGLINCQRIKCDKVKNLFNGKTVYDGNNEFQSKVIQTCNDGYVMECSNKTKSLKNECIRTCEENGRWSDEPAFCKDIRQCQKPKIPENGKYSFIDLKINDKIKYSCDKGYLIKGSNVRICLSDLTLSDNDPECIKSNQIKTVIPRGCSSPPNIPNTQLINLKKYYKNKEIIEIKCLKGFEDIINSNVNATCDDNTWMYIPIICRRIRCGKLEDPVEGKTLYLSNTEFEAVAFQVCNDGFITKCSDNDQSENKDCKRICGSDGNWSGQMTLCKQIVCPKLRPPNNGMVIESWNNVNNIVNYTCNKGYILNGSNMRKCQYNGEWDGTEATCILRDCGPPSKMRFATVGFNETTYGAEAVYTCNMKGRTSETSFKVKCTESLDMNVWLPKLKGQCMPYCSIINISHGRMVANNEYNISRKTFIKYNEALQIICDEGFELNNDVIPKCNNGSLSYIPKCVKASCRSKPPPKPFSTVKFISLKHNSVAKYRCDKGYGIKTKYNQNIRWIQSYEEKCIMGNWTNTFRQKCEQNNTGIVLAITKVALIFVGSIIILVSLLTSFLIIVCRQSLKSKKVAIEYERKDPPEIITVTFEDDTLSREDVT